MPETIDDNTRLRTNPAAEFLGQELGMPIAPKTLKNWRAKRMGPVPEYFGITPVYRVSELRRFAREDALTVRPGYCRPPGRSRRRPWPPETVDQAPA